MRTTVALGDALDVLIDHRGKTPKKLGGDWSSTGHRVVSALNIKNNRVDDNDHHYITDETYARWMKQPLRRGDVLLTSEAPTGEVAYLADDVEWALGQRLFALRGKPGLLDGRYLSYLLRGGDARHQMMSRTTGTTVTGIRQAELVKVELDLPPIEEQRGIAATLGALDDKIESNRRIESVVLDLAESIYEASCREGSATHRLKDLGRWVSGGTPSTSEPAYWGGDLPWVSSSTLKSFFVSESDRRLTPAGAAVTAYVLPKGSIVFVVRGMSLKSEFRVGVTTQPVAFGQDCKAILPTGSSSALGIALRVRRAEVLDLVDEAGHGTGRLQTDLLEALEIEVPADESAVATIDGLVERGAAAASESRRLAALRDALLPELLSGRIRVPEARTQIQGHTVEPPKET